MKIRKDALEDVNRHASQGYPYEICGLLLGQGLEVTEVRRATNIEKENPETRYTLECYPVLILLCSRAFSPKP